MTNRSPPTKPHLPRDERLAAAFHGLDVVTLWDTGSLLFNSLPVRAIFWGVHNKDCSECGLAKAGLTAKCNASEVSQSASYSNEQTDSLARREQCKAVSLT